MKKVVLYFMIVTLIFQFSACNNGEKSKNVNAIINEISKQAEENDITKVADSFYIPRIMADSSTAVSEIKLSKNETGDILISFGDFFYGSTSIDVGKYIIHFAQITHCKQDQSIDVFDDFKRHDSRWQSYNSNGKEFVFAVLSSDGDYVNENLIGLGYLIDSKTHVFISATVKDKIDNESKAIAVFKDFECKTLEELMK